MAIFFHLHPFHGLRVAGVALVALVGLCELPRLHTSVLQLSSDYLARLQGSREQLASALLLSPLALLLFMLSLQPLASHG